MKHCKKIKENIKQPLPRKCGANCPRRREVPLFDSFDDVECHTFGNFEYEVQRDGLIYRLNEREN